jgi:hypothetical protein
LRGSERVTGVRRAAGALILALAVVLPAPGRATVPGDAPVSGAEAPDAGAEAPVPRISGFRSAAFGDDESAVRRAIYRDFGLAGDDVVRTRNDLEQTTVLSIAVDDLIPDAGRARVSYVLGRGGRLIQVTVLWGLDIDPSVQTVDLEAAAALLMGYFGEQGYVSEGGPAPVAFVDGSNLLFYARDAEGGGLALSALPRRDPEAPADAPPILRIAYTADVANPDVFRAPSITP